MRGRAAPTIPTHARIGQSRVLGFERAGSVPADSREFSLPLDFPSPYARADLATLASAAARDALRGGPEGDDPVMAILYLEARQFMHGACTLLASHLKESRGLPVVLIQGHPPGQGWMMRHAMVCRCGAEEAAASIDAGRGEEVPVLDAAGGGAVGERLSLYREAGWDYRVILGRDPRNGASWMWEPRPGRPLSRQEHVVARLPALAHALDLPFDLEEALEGILGDLDAIPVEIGGSGLLEALSARRSPAAHL